MNSRKQYLYEFEGIYESPNCTFPYVVPNATVPGGIQLEWCNQGGICWGEGIDWDYFSTTQKMVGTMTGDVFNKLITWLPIENNTDSITYETFEIWDEWKNGTGHRYLSGYTCDDFAWKSLGLMKTWGVKFNANITSLSRVFINFYSKRAPVMLDLSDSLTYQTVVSSFAKYAIADKGAACARISDTTMKEMCAAEATLSLMKWLEANRLVLKNGRYYQMDRFGLDSFNWEFHLTPVEPVTLDDAFLAAVPVNKRHLFDA